MKGISFIAMIIHLDNAWGPCFVQRGQITSFILSDAFWIGLMLFYMIMFQRLQPKLMVLRRNLSIK